MDTIDTILLDHGVSKTSTILVEIFLNEKIQASDRDMQANITDAVTGAINTCIIPKQCSGKNIRYITTTISLNNTESVYFVHGRLCILIIVIVVHVTRLSRLSLNIPLFITSLVCDDTVTVLVLIDCTTVSGT